ncbi:MAG TPA: DUF1844 domain-containing protein [bacterium]|nr:DUF1844 domain-containing protein [bacterium]
MDNDEKKGGFKVSDRRKFVVEEDGSVKARETKTADNEETSPVEPEATPDESCSECDPDTYKNLPPIDFASFVISLSTSTMVYLGDLPDPINQKVEKDLTLAKQNIDLLGMLQEKTKGNLNDLEDHLLENALYDLRLRFVESCKKSNV